MPGFEHVHMLRVRYGETDQMGTFYNARALDWFECARTELLRAGGIPYALMEQRGVFLPVVEAVIRYRGRARYDDELRLTCVAVMCGRASARFDVEIARTDTGAAVVNGHTIHAVTGADGKPIRPPTWLTDVLMAQGKADCAFCKGETCIGACRD